MKKQKKNVVFMHVFFSILVVIGVSIMYNNSHYGEGLSWVVHENYEDTNAFSRQFKSDVNDIFDYIKYKTVFETNGTLDYTKSVIRVIDSPGTVKVYTIYDMIRHAKYLGYYLDKNFEINGSYPSKKDKDLEVQVQYRAYDPDFKAKEPGENFQTMDQLSYEVLSQLGNYLSFYYRFIQNSSNLKFEIYYQNTANDFKRYSNVSAEDLNYFKSLGKYLNITGEALYVDTNLTTVPKNISSQLEKWNPYNNGIYHMTIGLDTSYPDKDIYAGAAKAYDQSRFVFIIGIISFLIGALGFLATLYLLTALTIKIENSSLKNHVRHLPVELTIIAYIAGVCLALLICKELFYKIIHLFLSEEQWYYGELVLRVLLYYTFGLCAALRIIKQYKADILWSKSLTHQGLHMISLYFKNHRFTTRIMISYILFLLFNLITLLSIAFLLFTYRTLNSRILIGVIVFLTICVDLWIFHHLYKNAWETDQINQALLNISQGDTTYKIDSKNFMGKEWEIAEHINHISTGLEAALQEKIRSERLKTDLITNVSHDIKTPLTSIINYVDLIKREQLENPKIQGYLEVLEQKSHRLKTLTEDLVEASKASSGNLKLEIASIDLVQLIHQTNGEFKEKFSFRNLELIPTLPGESIFIEADGRYLWRVLENLYNNAFKYAMKNSRVYVNIDKKEDNVVFTMKNVSENPLNIRADELTERFVRGDVARATEGSGLGISIAKSLTELQGGEFLLYIDGDLFKAGVSFPIKK